MSFLADRTNGRAYAVLQRCTCVCRISVTLCIVAKRCVFAVLQQVTIDRTALKEVEHEKSIGTKMNDHDLRLEVVLRLCQSLPHICH